MTQPLRKLWTEEEIAFTLECLKAGMSASVTAATMNAKGMRADCAPVTRNAIVGVWNRNDKYRGNHFEIPKQKIRLKKKIQESIAKNKKRNYVNEGNGISFFSLKEGVCRFPYGDPDLEQLRYCGDPVDYTKGRAYCAMHYRVCYQPARKS